MQDTRVEQLLLPDRYENFSTEDVAPAVQERQRTMALEFSVCIGEFLRQPQLPSCRFGITATVAMDHIKPSDIRAQRYRVLMDAKTSWVGEVWTQYTETLEDILIMLVARYRRLRLKGVVRYVGHSRKRRCIGLG